jgi:hypothetical protein
MIRSYRAVSRSESNVKVLTSLIVCFASVALAEDFKAIDGKEYKNVTVSRVEPDGIVLTSSSGISKVYFTELPKEVQERFHYDQAKSAAYSAEQNASLEALRKQQQDAMRQKAEATAKDNKYAAEQLAADDSGKKQRNTIEGLQARYQELQKQEDDLLLRIGEAERSGSWGRVGNHRYYVPNGAADQLPYLRSHLNDVRHEKDKVRQRIEQGQH